MKGRWEFKAELGSQKEGREGGGIERGGRECGLPCRMSKRGGEEAELHQMKWGENNSGINQARAKGRVYCVFPPLCCGTERQGVNEGAYSGQQRSITGSQHQIMSDSNTITASTADQVSSTCHILFRILLVFLLGIKQVCLCYYCNSCTSTPA